MINNIRLFFLKRSWLRINNQIKFLCRELRKLRTEQNAVVIKFASRKTRPSFYAVEHNFGPINERVTIVEDTIRELEDRKRSIRLKIEGLRPVDVTQYSLA